METAQLVHEAIILFKTGKKSNFSAYMKKLGKQNPLAASLVRVRVDIFLYKLLESIKRGEKLLNRVSDKPELAALLFQWMGIAYRGVGELDISQNYFLRELEVNQYLRREKEVLLSRLNILLNKLYRCEYTSLYEEIVTQRGYVKRVLPKQGPYVDSLLAMLELFQGRIDRALTIARTLPDRDSAGRLKPSLVEVKALAARMSGDLRMAAITYSTLAEYLVDAGVSYAVEPCAEAMEICYFADLDMPIALAKKCLKVVETEAAPGEITGSIKVIRAFLARKPNRTSNLLFEAAKDYSRAFNHFRAFLVALAAGLVAWRCDSPVFSKSIKFVAPLAKLHPGFRSDPLIGPFWSRIESLIDAVNREHHQSGRIEAHLLGELKILVDGRLIPIKNWRSKKAAMAVIYLLLSPKHQMRQDRMFYLLWPRKKYGTKTKHLLYEVISIARKNLGSPQLLRKVRDFYQLEEVWTDLMELERIIREAENARILHDTRPIPGELQDMIQKELLPEIIDDPYVDEYQQYYKGLKDRVLRLIYASARDTSKSGSLDR